MDWMTFIEIAFKFCAALTVVLLAITAGAFVILFPIAFILSKFSKGKQKWELLI